MIVRTASLRELRAKKPANVEILPTAPPRRVQQKCNREKREAARDLRDRHASRFGYRHPHVRAQMKTAEALFDIEQTPGLHILVAMIAEMEPQELNRLAARLERCSANESARMALALVRYHSMPIGDRTALDAAMKILRQERCL